jgi:hypothetical protein
MLPRAPTTTPPSTSSATIHDVGPEDSSNSDTSCGSVPWGKLSQRGFEAHHCLLDLLCPALSAVRSMDTVSYRVLGVGLSPSNVYKTNYSVLLRYLIPSKEQKKHQKTQKLMDTVSYAYKLLHELSHVSCVLAPRSSSPLGCCSDRIEQRAASNSAPHRTARSSARSEPSSSRWPSTDHVR